jgi:hypothetical protein
MKNIPLFIPLCAEFIGECTIKHHKKKLPKDIQSQILALTNEEKAEIISIIETVKESHSSELYQNICNQFAPPQN